MWANVPRAISIWIYLVAVGEWSKSRYAIRIPSRTPTSPGASKRATQFSTVEDTSAVRDAALVTRKPLFVSKRQARREELPWIMKQSISAVRHAGVCSTVAHITVRQCVIEDLVGLALRLSLRISRVPVVEPSSRLPCPVEQSHLRVSLTAQGLLLVAIPG